MGDPTSSSSQDTLPKPPAQKPVSTAGEKILGIDVSHYEPPVDWAKAKAGGVMWMYTKASEGAGHMDSMLHQHVGSAKGAGVLTSAYHFFHANIDGNVQAKVFLDAVKEMHFELPMILDWEQGSVNGRTREIQIFEATKWLDVVEKTTGRVPWIYMGKALAKELTLPAKFSRYPVIFANYGTTIQRFLLTAPGPWARPTAWQYTDAETVPGLAHGHHCDANLFFGSMDDLKKFVA